MSDGTTGFQVAPTEDAAMLSTMFRKAADAIVNASTMRQELDNLQVALADAQAKVDNLKSHSDGLEQTIVELRQQRDEAKAIVQDELRMRKAAETEANLTKQDLDHVQQLLTDERRAHEDTKRERDDHGLTAMDLEDKLKQAQDKLATIQRALGIEPGPIVAPKPEPVQVPITETAPPTPTPDKPWWASNEPVPVKSPTDPLPQPTDDEIPF